MDIGITGNGTGEVIISATSFLKVSKKKTDSKSEPEYVYPTLGVAFRIPTKVKKERSDRSVAREISSMSDIFSPLRGCWSLTISTIFFCRSLNFNSQKTFLYSI